MRYAAVAQAVADRLGTVDPAHRADYAAHAKAFKARLAALDGEFRRGLAHCASTSIVTSHNAFGYLARRYGLSQVGITGLSPEAEPEAATLAARRDLRQGAPRQHDLRRDAGQPGDRRHGGPGDRVRRSRPSTRWRA